jgi:chromosome segregation ATPase
MNLAQFFAALTAAIPGIGAAVLVVWRSYIKQRDEAATRKQASHADHEAHGQKLDALQSALDTLTANLTQAQQDAAAVRTENDDLRKKVARLENQNDRLTAALAATSDAAKKKV